MLARHITHPSLDCEYYFVTFMEQKDIDDFCKKCKWFDKKDAHIYDSYIIEYHKDPEWYEIIPRNAFRNLLNNKLSVYNSVLMEFENFFQG